MIFENSSIAAATPSANPFATRTGFARKLYVGSHYTCEFITIGTHGIVGKIALLIRLNRGATGENSQKEPAQNPNT